MGRGALCGPHNDAALLAIVVQGMRHISLWKWRGMRIGRTLVRAIPLSLFAMKWFCGYRR